MKDSKESRADVNGSREMMRHLEQDARRKLVEFERLVELSRNDPTINTFIEAWRRGHFRSFEDMLCKLAVQLATEKAGYMQTATKAIQLAPVPSVIVTDKAVVVGKSHI
jgi:hypothetical protein